VWKLEGIRKEVDKVNCCLCLCKESIKHILLDCKVTRNWRKKFVNEKCLNMNKEISYKKTR